MGELANYTIDQMAGELANYTIDQMAGALALTLGSVGGLCLILFKSRCERISICWGFWSCNRKVVDEEDAVIPKVDDTPALIPPSTPIASAPVINP